MSDEKKIIRTIKARNGRYYDTIDGDVAPEGCIAAHPRGGGFVVHIPKDEVEEWDAIVPVEFKRAVVGFDGEPFVTAYYDPLDRWNGWLLPKVDRENLDKFLAEEANCNKEAPDDCYIIGKLVGTVLHITQNGEHEEIPMETIEFEGKPVEVWSIGLGLIWEDCSDVVTPTKSERQTRATGVIITSHLDPGPRRMVMLDSGAHYCIEDDNVPEAQPRELVTIEFSEGDHYARIVDYKAPPLQGPRFVWLIGDIREQYPDAPEPETDGAIQLWDRQEKQVVATVYPKYAQAICLEHVQHGTPFTDLARWFNGLTNEDLSSEGLPMHKQGWDEDEISRPEASVTDGSSKALGTA